MWLATTVTHVPDRTDAPLSHISVPGEHKSLDPRLTSSAPCGLQPSAPLTGSKMRAFSLGEMWASTKNPSPAWFWGSHLCREEVQRRRAKAGGKKGTRSCVRSSNGLRMKDLAAYCSPQMRRIRTDKPGRELWTSCRSSLAWSLLRLLRSAPWSFS